MFRRMFVVEKKKLRKVISKRVWAGGSLLVSSGQEVLSQEPAQRRGFPVLGVTRKALGLVARGSQGFCHNAVVRKAQLGLRGQSCP